MTELLRVTVGNGKYTVIQDAKGALRALRYGEEWRDCCGDGMILVLAQEVANLKELAKQVANGNFNQADVIATARRLL